MDEDFGALESVKASSELVSPVSGTVISVNEELETNPELVNTDPYGAWIIKVKLSDPAQLNTLMKPEEYTALISK